MKKLYLLGAGFSKSVLGDIMPVTNELFDKLDIKQIKDLSDLYEFSYPDIEIFFSLLDLQIIKNEFNDNSKMQLLNKYKNQLIIKIVKHLEPPEAKFSNLNNIPLLNKFINSIPSNAIIMSLNYDTILDRGLWISNNWSPNGGYYLSVFPHESSIENNQLKNILLLKLHGSINFKLERHDLLAHLGYGPNKHNIYIEVSDNIFPKINSNTNSDMVQPGFYETSPYIMIFSYLKIFNNGLYVLWRKALKEIQNADNLTIIGTSLRDEDTFLKFLVSNLGANLTDVNKTIEIVDLDENSCEKLYKKIIGNFLIPYTPIPQTNFYYGLEQYLIGTPNRIKDN